MAGVDLDEGIGEVAAGTVADSSEKRQIQVDVAVLSPAYPGENFSALHVASPHRRSVTALFFYVPMFRNLRRITVDWAGDQRCIAEVGKEDTDSTLARWILLLRAACAGAAIFEF